MQPPWLATLQSYGDAHHIRDWPDFEPDYVTEMGLTRDDLPALLAIAWKWADVADSDDDGLALWAPVHAWRAVGQLRALDAVPQLLELSAALEATTDDWFHEEFPLLFGLIGPDAFDTLAAYFADGAHSLYTRNVAAVGLAEIVKRHPELRERAIAQWTGLLDKHREEDGEFNAFVVSVLLSVGATEAAESIERAYAADCVDEFIVGWADVKRELGIEGLGLVPDRPARPFPFLERLGLDIPVATKPGSTVRRNGKIKKKAKRKQQSRSRRRNRRR